MSCAEQAGFEEGLGSPWLSDQGPVTQSLLMIAGGQTCRAKARCQACGGGRIVDRQPQARDLGVEQARGSSPFAVHSVY